MMDKSRSGILRKERKLDGSRENENRQIDGVLAVCQMQIVNKANCREILNKSMSLLINAREKILLYDDHADYARRKLKEAREAIYLMDVDDINLAAEFEEKIQAAIQRLAKLEENPLRAEHKAELCLRISEAEQIVRSLQSRNEVIHDTLKKKIAVIVQSRQDATARRYQPLATRNTIDDKN